MTDTATLRQRLIDADSSLALHARPATRAAVIEDVVVAFLREQAETWRAPPDPLGLDVYTDVVRDGFRRLASLIKAGDL